MIISIKHILKDLQNEVPSVTDILRIIYCYYLSKKEKDHYHVLLLFLQGKPQKDLGILLNVQQYKVSEYLSKLLSKIRKISYIFTHKTEFENFLKYLKEHLTKKQYRVLCYLFAGNKQIAVARKLKCSPTAVFYTLQQIRKKLPKTECTLLHKYLTTFRN